MYGMPDDEFMALGPWERIKHVAKNDRGLQLGVLILIVMFFLKWMGS